MNQAPACILLVSVRGMFSVSRVLLITFVGLATAAGCQLVASCDIAVASEKASFATPGYELSITFCIDNIFHLCQCSEVTWSSVLRCRWTNDLEFAVS